MRFALALFLFSTAVLADTEKFTALETRFEKEGKSISLDSVRNPASLPSNYSGVRTGYCVNKAENSIPYAFISEVRGKRVTWMVHSLKGSNIPEGGAIDERTLQNLKKNVYGPKSANRKLFTLPAETQNGISFFKTVSLKNSEIKGDPAAQQFFVKEGPVVFQGTKPDIFMKITCEKADGCGEVAEKGGVMAYCRFSGAHVQAW